VSRSRGGAGTESLTRARTVNVTKQGGVEHVTWAVVPRDGYLGRAVYSFCEQSVVPFLLEAERLAATHAAVEGDVV